MNAGSEVVRSNGPLRSPRTVGRKRRVAGWLLTTAGVIVAALWVASGWWRLHKTEINGTVDFDSGSATFRRFDFGFPQRWQLSQHSLSWRWRATSTFVEQPGTYTLDGVLFWYESAGPPQFGESRGLDIVLWPIPLLLWTSAALLLRSGILARRRANTNACAKCGYSLAGLGDGAPCPECGKRAKVTA